MEVVDTPAACGSTLRTVSLGAQLRMHRTPPTHNETFCEPQTARLLDYRLSEESVGNLASLATGRRYERVEVRTRAARATPSIPG